MAKIPPEIPPNFAALGCDFPDVSLNKRIYLGIDAHTKAGTTHFALGMSKFRQMIYININKGLMGVVQKFKRSRIIEKKILFSKDQSSATEALKEYVAVWREAVANDIPVVVDKHTEVWEIARIATFGDKRPKSIHYGPINAVMTEILDMAAETKGHVILIHSLNPEYVKAGEDEAATGEFIRAGFKKTQFKVEINARLRIDKPATQVLTIENTRWGLEFNGRELTGEDASFMGLGQALFGVDWDPNNP